MGEFILVIEDDRSIAELEKRHLEKGGMRVRIAGSGREALDLLLGEEKPALLIIDYRLPDLSGVEILQKVKDMGLNLPSIIVTAAGNEKVAVSAMKLGAMDYIVKDRETIKNLPATCRDVITKFNLGAEHARVVEEMKVLNMQLLESNQRLDELARRDDLTGVFNRRYLMEALSYETSRTTRYREPLCFAIFDLDHFKLINDSFGHATGDLVIKQFAALVAGRLRKTDIFGRYGGEEFAAILTGTPLVKAIAICEELRALVERTSFGFDHAPLKITVSAGVANYTPSINKDELIELADQGLYKAKNEGRNRVGGSAPRD